MELIDGNRIAESLIAELKAEVSAIRGRMPCLALVRVGDDPHPFLTYGGKNRG